MDAQKNSGGGRSAAGAHRRERNASKRCRVRSLWPLWYAALAIALQIFLIYQGCVRYFAYRCLPWKSSPSDTLNAYVALLVMSGCCLPATAAALFARTGSYASGGMKIGRDRLKHEISQLSKGLSLGRLIWTCMIPIAPALHMIAGFCLLLPAALAEARALSGEFLVAEDSSWLFLFDGTQLYFNVSSGGDNVTASSVTMPSLTMEFVNLIFATFVYSIRYASVFWFTSRFFSVVFSCQLLGAAILHGLSFCGWKSLLASMYSHSSDTVYTLTPASLTCLYVAGNAVLFSSSVTVFHYGYAICREKLRTYLRKFHKSNGPTIEREGCRPYAPHTLALVVIIIFVACNGPIMYDYVTVYKRQGDRLLLAHLICNVVYMLLWIMQWFSFTVKQTWNFAVQEVVIKRYSLMLYRQRIFSRGDREDNFDPEDTPSSNSSVAQDANAAATVTASGIEGGSTLSGDSLSNASMSTSNDGYDAALGRTPNGILSQKIKQKRRSAEQKVKFQDATKVVIETNLDSDLDTIPESTNEDSAVFSSSNHSRDSKRELSHIQSLSSSPSLPYVVDGLGSAGRRRNGSSSKHGMEHVDSFALLRMNGISTLDSGKSTDFALSVHGQFEARSSQRDKKVGTGDSRRDSAIFSINSSQENSDCEINSRQLPNLRLNSAV